MCFKRLSRAGSRRQLHLITATDARCCTVKDCMALNEGLMFLPGFVIYAGKVNICSLFICCSCTVCHRPSPRLFLFANVGPISALQQRAQLCCTCLTEFAFQQTCGGSCVGQCVLWKRMTIIPLLFRHLDVCHLGLLGSHTRASSRLGGAAILVLARQTLFWC